VRALFQAIEVCLVNLEALARVASHGAEDDDHDRVARAMGWMVAFGRVWVDLVWRRLQPTL
jgi:hypothetical protein